MIMKNENNGGNEGGTVTVEPLVILQDGVYTSDITFLTGSGTGWRVTTMSDPQAVYLSVSSSAQYNYVATTTTKMIDFSLYTKLTIRFSGSVGSSGGSMSFDCTSNQFCANSALDGSNSTIMSNTSGVISTEFDISGRNDTGYLALCALSSSLNEYASMLLYDLKLS